MSVLRYVFFTPAGILGGVDLPFAPGISRRQPAIDLIRGADGERRPGVLPA